MPFNSRFYKPKNGSDTIAEYTHAEWYEKSKDLIGRKFKGEVPGHNFAYEKTTFDGDITLEQIQDILDDRTFEVNPHDCVLQASLIPSRRMVLIDEEGSVWGVSVG